LADPGPINRRGSGAPMGPGTVVHGPEVHRNLAFIVGACTFVRHRPPAMNHLPSGGNWGSGIIRGALFSALDRAKHDLRQGGRV